MVTLDSLGFGHFTTNCISQPLIFASLILLFLYISHCLLISKISLVFFTDFISFLLTSEISLFLVSLVSYVYPCILLSIPPYLLV